MRFRHNVGALIRYENSYLACCRKDYHTWQSVQGGIENFDISPMNALIRELNEELGLKACDFKIIYQSKYWRRYFFTKKIHRNDTINFGQDQLWFLVELFDKKILQSHFWHHEFEQIEFVSLNEFLQRYAVWKKLTIVDFCREINLY